MHIAIQIADQTAETIWRAFRDRLVEMGWKSKMSFELIRTGLRLPGGSSTKQKDVAYLLNQHRPKHTGRWDKLKTMSGICDKWDTGLLRTLMCRKV